VRVVDAVLIGVQWMILLQNTGKQLCLNVFTCCTNQVHNVRCTWIDSTEHTTLTRFVGRVSSVGIATHYGMDNRGSNPGRADPSGPAVSGEGLRPISCCGYGLKLCCVL
jgi:hypothetical protein